MIGFDCAAKSATSRQEISCYIPYLLQHVYSSSLYISDPGQCTKNSIINGCCQLFSLLDFVPSESSPNLSVLLPF